MKGIQGVMIKVNFRLPLNSVYFASVRLQMTCPRGVTVGVTVLEWRTVPCVQENTPTSLPVMPAARWQMQTR